MARKSNHGFTLLEIAIAVTLLAMVMTLAAVQVRGYHARQQLEYAAHQMQLRLQGLRQKSIREEKTFAVRVDWKNSCLVWSAPTNDEAAEAESSDSQKWTDFETLYQVEEPVEFLKPAPGRTEKDEAIYFFQDGRCTPAVFQLEHGRTKESLWISLTDWSGEVTILQQP